MPFPRILGGNQPNDETEEVGPSGLKATVRGDKVGRTRGEAIDVWARREPSSGHRKTLWFREGLERQSLTRIQMTEKMNNGFPEN